jgi:hypothetical protein
MPTKKPKDLALAEVAYNAFYAETPQVFFDDLSPTYQMRWVRAIRSAVADYRKLKPAAGGTGNGPSERKPPAKPEVRSHKKKANGVGVPPERLAEWRQKDAEDLGVFTDRPYKEKSQAELQARHRFSKRNKQRERYGLEVTQSVSV